MSDALIKAGELFQALGKYFLISEKNIYPTNFLKSFLVNAYNILHSDK